MKTNTLFTLAFVLGTFLLPSAFADSPQVRKDQRYEQRGDEGKTRYKEKKQKQKNQHEQKNSRVNTKNSHPGQRHQDAKNQQKPRKDVRDHKKQNKQLNREDRHYSTRRYNDHNRKYDRDPKRGNVRTLPRKERYVNRHYYSRSPYRDNRHYELRHGKRLLKLTPRHRTFRNVYIVRPFGHSYFGYGHFLNDHNAWRWLGFTAITLKLLDMVDEQAQREHETAQIEATTADVGERIYWDTDDASGYVMTTREGRSNRGLPCREYQQSITVGGKTEEAYGSACLQADGAWKIVD